MNNSKIILEVNSRIELLDILHTSNMLEKEMQALKSDI